MSYANNVKSELMAIKKNRLECKAFLYGMLLNAKCNETTISFVVGNEEVGEYYEFLIHKLFPKTKIEKSVEHLNVLTQNTYDIKDEDYTISNFFDLFNIHSSFRDEIINNNKLIQNFLAGAFVTRGSVNDPSGSNYHFELSFDNSNTAIYVQKMINIYDFNAKIIKRRKNLIVYIKEAEKIVDLLRIMGSKKEAFNYEDVRIERDFNNSINRIMNCEIANEEKTLKAAKEQLKYILYLEYNYPLEKLDHKLLLVMKVRKDNMEASLNELVAIIKEVYDIDISKPGLSHRFSKIKELAVEHAKERKNVGN